MNHHSLNPDVTEESRELGLDGGKLPLELGIGENLGAVHTEAGEGVLDAQLDHLGGESAAVIDEGDEGSEEVVVGFHERMLAGLEGVASGRIERAQAVRAGWETIYDLITGGRAAAA